MATNREKGRREAEGQRSETQAAKRGAPSQGSMTVEEAGHKGGQRERELVEEGHRSEEGKPRR